MTVPHRLSQQPEESPLTPPLLLTVEEAAEYLGVGRSTMYGLIRDGEVESIRIGRLRRIPSDALPAFLARLRESESLARQPLSA
jgi:excisionase family DNA binding protein